MTRPLWFVEMLKRAFPAKHLLAKITLIPFFGGVIERFFFANDHIIYLPMDNVVNIQVNQNLEQSGEMVLPSDIVHRMIDKANFIWMMSFCICRVANHCTDYPQGYGCLFMGEAARGINPDLGREVSRAEAHEYIRNAAKAGLVHMIGRNKIDTMWLGVGPGDRLLTVCNCCPCCCLWTILPDLHPDIAKKVSRMPGVSVNVNDGCSGCGECINVCFVNAISMINNKAVISDECRGCGRCFQVCPVNAIKIRYDNLDGPTKSIDQLTRRVDVT